MVPRALLAFGLVLTLAAPARGQAAGDAGPAARPLPVSLDRIRRELERPDTLRRSAERDERPMFSVEIEVPLPRFADFVGEGELLQSPSPWGGMTHSDFLAMVTPAQARAYGAFTNADLLQVVATSIASAYALNGAAGLVEDVKSMLRERRTRAAREEVLEVLATLERLQREQARLEQERAERKKAAEAGLIKDPPR